MFFIVFLVRIPFQIAADKNLALGQYNLAYCYKYGQGVSQNLKKAFELFKLAADNSKENINAQYHLALAYQAGDGCKKNLEEAVKYLHLAADADKCLARAQTELGRCYLKATGCVQDDTKAFHYFSLGAEQKNSIAQSNVGFCYQHGRGVYLDDFKAIVNYFLAAKQGSIFAKEKLISYQDSAGNNIWHLALLKNDPALVMYLAKEKDEHKSLEKDLVVLNKAGHTPLSLAFLQETLPELALRTFFWTLGSLKSSLQKEDLLETLFDLKKQQGLEKLI